MKKVLIIGYPFPLRRGGSPRLLGFAKYLPEFGWQPVILTAPLDRKPDPQFRIIETPYRDALGFWKRLFGFNPDENIRNQVKERFGITSNKSLMDFIVTRVGEIVNYPDFERGWEPFAVASGEKLLQEEKIDAIISTSAPVTTHFVAKKLKDRHRIPWVADLRDLWSQNHNYIYSPLRRLLDRRLEQRTLSCADALVTVSQPWADKLSTLHRDKVTHVITSGFNPEIINIPPVKLSPKFSITYTGLVHVKHDPSKFLAALRNLIVDGTINPSDIEVRFYGPESLWLDKESERYGLSDIVKQHGMVPQEIALQKQKESQLLLIFGWEGREKAAYSGKLFEYLAAQRPILATGTSNDMTNELLDETRAGLYGSTIEEVKNVLSEFYLEYKSKSGVTYKGDRTQISKYSFYEMTKKFADILDTITRKGPEV